METILRLISCTLVILIALTVLLSGQGSVHAASGQPDAGHHGMVIETSSVAKPISHDPHSSHGDICGMTVCGPYVDQQNGLSMFMPIVSAATFWIKDRPVASADADGNYRPPRA
ncbi:hypothetical protein MACH01_21270 [Thalassospira tepidiphila]|nr:hypothetical protein MACH01_21270 [Thalassospira tepidiphila]